jgi:hypothetical protein
MALTQVDQGLLGQYAQYTGFKNRIINGQMQIDQRNAGASVSLTTSVVYSVDRWATYASQTGKATIQQNAGSVTPPSGFTKYVGVTSSSAYSVTSGDIFQLFQNIEGLNVADFGWGTASAQTVTLSFWVRSSLTGTFAGSLYNSGGTRSYPFTYTISSANTWEQKTVTIAGDTSGTWLTTTGIGIGVNFNLGAGSTWNGTANSWNSGNYVSTTGATSVVGTSGATFYITGVQLEKGSTATSFDYRPYGTELALCQRYYEILWSPTLNWQGNVASIYSTTRAFIKSWHKVSKRTAPTVTVSNPSFVVAYNGSSVSATSSANQYPTIDSTSIEVTGTYTLGFSAHIDISGSCTITASAEL